MDVRWASLLFLLKPENKDTPAAGFIFVFVNIMGISSIIIRQAFFSVKNNFQEQQGFAIS
jgi:hypothetical protein